MNRFARILKHRWFDETDTRRALGAPALDRIEARIGASERQHGGEIRVCIEAGLPLSYLWHGCTARERAISVFSKLRVWDTEQNSGVLIYLLLAEHAIEIVADRGLNRHISSMQWQTMVQRMGSAFATGDFETGLTQAMEEVSALLVQHFPETQDTERHGNQLPDAPDLR